MSNEEYYTTQAYADLHGLSVSVVQYHCAKDNLECIKLTAAGHGAYMIPPDAEIIRKKVGRKIGWRKKKE